MSWTSAAAKGLGWNIIGMFAIVSWTGITCFFMFYILKKMGQLRVPPEHEFKGNFKYSATTKVSFKTRRKSTFCVYVIVFGQIN